MEEDQVADNAQQYLDDDEAEDVAVENDQQLMELDGRCIGCSDMRRHTDVNR